MKTTKQAELMIKRYLADSSIRDGVVVVEGQRVTVFLPKASNDYPLFASNMITVKNSFPELTIEQVENCD